MQNIPENNHTPPGKVNGNPRGRKVTKAQFFEGRYDAKLEFLEGWGRGCSILENTFCGRGMDIFCNNTIELCMIFQAWDCNVLAVHFFKVTIPVSFIVFKSHINVALFCCIPTNLTHFLSSN